MVVKLGFTSKLTPIDAANLPNSKLHHIVKYNRDRVFLNHMR